MKRLWISLKNFLKRWNLVRIDWQEYRDFRKEKEIAGQRDKFLNLVCFIISFYNIHSYERIYEIIKNDYVGNMMMQKNGINSVLDLENYVSKYRKTSF